MLQSSSTSRSSHPLDRPLHRRAVTGSEVSLSAFALLFGELVQLHQTTSSSVPEFEGEETANAFILFFIRWRSDGLNVGVFAFLSKALRAFIVQRSVSSLHVSMVGLHFVRYEFLRSTFRSRLLDIQSKRRSLLSPPTKFLTPSRHSLARKSSP